MAGSGPNAGELRYSRPVGILSCEMTIDGRHVHSRTLGPDRPDQLLQRHQLKR